MTISPRPVTRMLTMVMMSMVLPASAQPGEERPEKSPLLPVSGRIVDGTSNLVGSSVKVFCDNDLVFEQVTERSGKFQIGLALGHLFTVQFEHPGHVTKRIVVDTHANIDPKELAMMPLQMDVMMLPISRYEGADTDVMDMPFAMVRYDKRIGAFVQDLEYTADMQRANGAALLQAGRARK